MDERLRFVARCRRLPSMRLWRSRALTRDLVALTTVLSAVRHYNVTMESRSFHIVYFVSSSVHVAHENAGRALYR